MALNPPEWRKLSLAELEKEYSPSSMIGGNYQPFIKSYIDDSARAYQSLACHRHLRYGAGPRALLDFFPARSSAAGLLIFIHGGYWQELSKNESSLLAPAWVAAGLAHAVIDYDLAPAITLEGIVAQCHEAIDWLLDRASELGFDADQVVVAGSSAGAHLAAMVCLQKPRLRGAVLLSGLYDLEPLVPTYVNQALGLDASRAQRLSPLGGLRAATLQGFTRPRFPPCVVAYGEIETLEFKRQSVVFAEALNDANALVTTVQVPARNHFDLVNELAQRDGDLFKLSFKLFGP
jgi:arylformamidase